MRIHDWTRVESGLSLDFHQGWTVAVSKALNDGLLPASHFAIIEPSADDPEPILVPSTKFSGIGENGTAVAAPPRTRLVKQLDSLAPAPLRTRLEAST